MTPRFPGRSLFGHKFSALAEAQRHAHGSSFQASVSISLSSLSPQPPTLSSAKAAGSPAHRWPHLQMPQTQNRWKNFSLNRQFTLFSELSLRLWLPTMKSAPGLGGVRAGRRGVLGEPGSQLKETGCWTLFFPQLRLCLPPQAWL